MLHSSLQPRAWALARTLAAALLVSCAAPREEALHPGDGEPQASSSVRTATDTAWLLGVQPADDAVHAGDSEESLVARYGSVNVKREPVDEGEGMLVPGTVVFPDDAERRLEIQWRDTVAYRQPRFVSAIGNSWIVHPGVGLGTSLRQLEQMNGGPFELSGFGGHTPGTVTDWRSGRLATFGATGETGYDTVTLRLQPPTPYPPGADAERYGSENLFLSSDPGIQLLNPRVVAIVIQPR